MTTMPAQKPGRSKQDYATPPEFIAAVKSRLRIERFAFDLAADMYNAKAQGYFTEEQDSLTQNWWMAGGVNYGWCWLNPPFSNIEPWAKKCSETTGVNIAFLVPAAVGANWFRDHVDGKAHVLLLNGRICFDGVGPYPKDCVLCLYGPFRNGYEVWDWRKDVPA
jgi:phage N-6-adenine-methyltransferase